MLTLALCPWPHRLIFQELTTQSFTNFSHFAGTDLRNDSSLLVHR